MLQEILERYEGAASYFFHCGDSELDPQDEIWQKYIAVKGNCDYGGGFPDERVVKTGQDTVYITHGHLSNVRFGLTQLSLKAEAAQANLVLFGHTHQIGCEMHNGVLYVNPGSVTQPRGQILIPAYAVIDSNDEEFDVQYFHRDHEQLKDLHFVFKKQLAKNNFF